MTTTPVEAAAMPEEAFGVGGMNIPAAKGQGGDLSRASTRKCLSQASPHVGLLGTQETIEDEDNEDIDAVLKPKDWFHYQAASENDILIKRTRWKPSTRIPKGFKQNGRVHLSEGLAHVSPERNATYAIMDWIARPDWSPFIFIDIHLVSGVHAGSDHLPFREHARSEAFDVLTDLVADARTAGLIVILVGDTNWGRMPKLHRDWVWCGDGASIDKMGYLNAPDANWSLSFLTSERYANPSDHDFRAWNVVGRQKAVTPPKPKTLAEQMDDFLATVTTPAGDASAITDPDRATLRGIVKGH